MDSGKSMEEHTVPELHSQAVQQNTDVAEGLLGTACFGILCSYLRLADVREMKRGLEKGELLKSLKLP